MLIELLDKPAGAGAGAVRAGGVKAARQEFRGDKLNVCDFECHKSTIISHKPCGATVRLPAEAVPGCTGFKPGSGLTGNAQAAVKQACAAKNAKCDSKTSVFVQAASDPDVGSLAPAKQCAFDCYRAAGWLPGSKRTKCGQQVVLGERDAPGCSSLQPGDAVPTAFKWFSDVTRKCLALGGRCTEEEKVTLASVSDAPAEEEGKSGFDTECLFSCVQHNTFSADASCAATIALPEAIVPGCSRKRVGEKVAHAAIAQMCKLNLAAGECDSARGLFVGVADESLPQFAGGVLCMSKDGHAACAKYAAEYAPIAGMYEDGQARVAVKALPATAAGARGFYFAHDKVVADSAYGEDADSKFRVHDVCPAVPTD